MFDWWFDRTWIMRAWLPLVFCAGVGIGAWVFPVCK
jgi:hypothetical protein